MLRTIFAMAVGLCIGAIANAQTQSQEASGSRIEAATFFGAMLAGKEIARGVNATGGEHLIAKLGYGGALGVRGGIHSDLLGMEANFLTTSNPAVVKNEFGGAFPNHAERPLIYSGDALLYPFRRAIKAGLVRPYLMSGIGGMLLSADLDNVRDKETHGGLIWNTGGGMKVFVGESGRLYVDLRFTNHRLLRTTTPYSLQSLSIGVGARF